MCMTCAYRSWVGRMLKICIMWLYVCPRDLWCARAARALCVKENMNRTDTLGTSCVRLLNCSDSQHFGAQNSGISETFRLCIYPDTDGGVWSRRNYILKSGAESQVGEPAGKKAQQSPSWKIRITRKHVVATASVLSNHSGEKYCSYPVSGWSRELQVITLNS